MRAFDAVSGMGPRPTGRSFCVPKRRTLAAAAPRDPCPAAARGPGRREANTEGERATHRLDDEVVEVQPEQVSVVLARLAKVHEVRVQPTGTPLSCTPMSSVPPRVAARAIDLAAPLACREEITTIRIFPNEAPPDLGRSPGS